MSDRKERETWRLKVKPAAILKPGPRKPDLIEIPEMSGSTMRVNVRIDDITAELLQTHYERLQELAPGTAITLSDVIRSLLHRGSESYEAEFSNKTKDPSNA